MSICCTADIYFPCPVSSLWPESEYSTEPTRLTETLIPLEDTEWPQYVKSRRQSPLKMIRAFAPYAACFAYLPTAKAAIASFYTVKTTQWHNARCAVLRRCATVESATSLAQQSSYQEPWTFASATLLSRADLWFSPLVSAVLADINHLLYAPFCIQPVELFPTIMENFSISPTNLLDLQLAHLELVRENSKLDNGLIAQEMLVNYTVRPNLHETTPWADRGSILLRGSRQLTEVMRDSVSNVLPRHQLQLDSSVFEARDALVTQLTTNTIPIEGYGPISHLRELFVHMQ